MSIVKKWTSCVLSFVAGVLGVALSACSGMVVSISANAGLLPGVPSTNLENITKAFKVITDNQLYEDAKSYGASTQFIWLKVFAIITLIVSILLIAYSIVKLLQNVNVIKSEHAWINVVGRVLICLLLVATIGLLISTNCYANAIEDSLLAFTKAQYLAQGLNAQYLANIVFKVEACPGVYQYAMLVVAIVTFVANGVVEIVCRKK